MAGVDTHKDVHGAVVLDRLGYRLGVRAFPAADAGNESLMGWLAGFGQVSDAGVEGMGSPGWPRWRPQQGPLPPAQPRARPYRHPLMRDEIIGTEQFPYRTRVM